MQYIQQNTNTDGIFDLPQIPVFHPTEEEFEDPWKYVSKIQSVLAITGVCIIEPPRSVWDKDITLKYLADDVSFPTKAQQIDKLRFREGPNAVFMKRLMDYWSAVYGTELQVPVCNGVDVDLYKVMKVLQKNGGGYKIRKDEEWERLAREMNIDITGIENPGKFIQELFMIYINPLKDEYIPEDKNWNVGRKRKVRTRRSKGKTNSLPDTRSTKKRDRDKETDELPQKKKMRISVPMWREVIAGSWNNNSNKPDGFKSRMAGIGYQVGKEFTIKEFREMADRFEASRFPNIDNVTTAMKEREYWNIVNDAETYTRVYYGSDLDVKNQGSLFPTDVSDSASDIENYMAKSGWNPNNLAFSTFLHHLGESVAGVTRPMLYVGMCFSSFCWHVEDNFLYSINYLHCGAGKRWYGVPGYAAEKFENVMKENFPDLFKKAPNLLHLLITMIPPDVLKANGVPVFTGTQNVGQFIITSPRAYHAGFNLGFNIAESVNFAVENWLPYCKIAVDSYRFLRNSIFPYEEFVIKAAKNPDSYATALLLRNALQEIIYNETALQKNLISTGFQSDYSDKDKEHFCEACGYDCYLSWITCKNCESKVSCLFHHKDTCACQITEKKLTIRYSIENLMEVYNDLINNINKMISQNNTVPCENVQ